MKLVPVLTEKSMQDAQEGKYTFFVDRNMTKHGIKDLVAKVFKVTVSSVQTINSRGRVKKTWQGKKKQIMPTKKAIVTLKGKDTIDIFEENKK